MNIHPFKKEIIVVEDSVITYVWWKSYSYQITYNSSSVIYSCKDLESARSFAQGEIIRRQDAVVEKLKGN